MLVVAGLVVAACGTEPVRMMPGDLCARCRRVIAETRVAAELVDKAGRAYKFHSAGCMAKYLKKNPDDQSAELFATDYGTGRLVKVSSVKFVPTMMDKDLDYAAYYTDKGAAEAAGREKSTPIDWQKVLADATPQ
jgi:hypothetical protein